MNYLLTKIKYVIATKPSNAFLLFLTGFFFTQVMLFNILHTKHPLGGWDTPLGMFTTRSILISLLFILSLCLIALWRSADKKESFKVTKILKTNFIKTRDIYSPLVH